MNELEKFYFTLKHFAKIYEASVRAKPEDDYGRGCADTCASVLETFERAFVQVKPEIGAVTEKIARVK